MQNMERSQLRSQTAAEPCGLTHRRNKQPQHLYDQLSGGRKSRSGRCVSELSLDIAAVSTNPSELADLIPQRRPLLLTRASAAAGGGLLVRLLP